MSEKSVSENSTTDRVCGEDQFVESLRQIWEPHQQRDLEIRYQMGVLLNKKLRKPTVRQSYGMATIERVSEELSIDKSDISRMRRFAAKYDSFETFREQEPGATCWTHVRKLIVNNKATDRPKDRRTNWGVQRSLKSLIEAFGSDYDFSGSEKADEIRQSIRELIELAKSKFDLDFV